GIEAHIDIIDGAFRADSGRQLIATLAPMCVAACGCHCGKQVEAREATCSTRSLQVGARPLQVLVLRERVVHQAVELGILEKHPELCLDLTTIEAGLADIGELWWNGRYRPLIVGSDRT